MKTCTKCGKEKPDDAFFPRSDHNGLRSHCKACLRRTPEQATRRRELHSIESERDIRSGIIQRCHNPNNPAYVNYGARGISVCQRWRDSFEAFIADVGRRPSLSHTIERKNNNGNYEPGNVKWATRTEQNNNTRQNVFLTARGRTQTRTEWAKEVGVLATLIRDRMERFGWDAERAIFTPARPIRRRNVAQNSINL